MFDLLPTAEALAKAVRAALAGVGALTVRAIPASVITSVPHAGGAESTPSAGAAPPATPTPAEGGRDMAALIADVLAEHEPYQYSDNGFLWCLSSDRMKNDAFRGDWTWEDWREHVSEAIAERLNAVGTQHATQDRPRPLDYANFYEQHTK